MMHSCAHLSDAVLSLTSDSFMNLHSGVRNVLPQSCFISIDFFTVFCIIEINLQDICLIKLFFLKSSAVKRYFPQNCNEEAKILVEYSSTVQVPPNCTVFGLYNARNRQKSQLVRDQQDWNDYTAY